MRILSTAVILLLWTTKNRTEATLPFMQKVAQKLFSTSSTPNRPTRAATTTTTPFTQRTNVEYHRQNSNHQQNHGFTKLHNLVEQSQRTTFTSTGRDGGDWNGQNDDMRRAPIPQKFTMSEGYVPPLAPNFGTPRQLSPSITYRHHRHHHPIPLTFPPSPSPPPPPPDSYPRIISLPPLAQAYHQQQELPESSSHYTTSSLSYSFQKQNGYSNSGGYDSLAPAPKKVVRHVSVFVAPPETPYKSDNRQRIQVQGNAEKHVNIIFIKGPESSQSNLAEVNLPPIPEQKTLVYVLNKAQNDNGQVIVNAPEPPKYNPPDVYFIKYKDNQNNGHQHQHQQYGVPPQAQEKSDQQQPPQEYGNPSPVQNQQYHHHVPPPSSPPPEQHYNTPPPHYQQVPPTVQPQQTYNPPPQQQNQNQDDSIPERYTILLPPPVTTSLQHQPGSVHGASSNQKFNYTYPSVVYSQRVIQSNSSENKLIDSNDNVTTGNAIYAERRMEDVSDAYDTHQHSHNFKYDFSYHSLINSEEENTVDVDGKHRQSYGKLGVETGNGLFPSSPFPNSGFFQNADVNSQAGSAKKAEGRILSLINAIFSTKANTSTKSLSSSPVIVKYNVADRVLAVGSNHNGNISLGMGTSASGRDGYSGSKNVKSDSTNGIKGVQPEVVDAISHDHHDPNLLVLTRQNLTALAKDADSPITRNKGEGDGGGGNSSKNGSNVKNGRPIYISGRAHDFSPYKYAPFMGYNYFGITANKTLI